MDESSKLLCKNCRHSFVPLHFKILGLGRPDKYHYHCRKSVIPAKIDFDPVIGPEKKSKEYKMCLHLRSFNGNFCGPEGTEWEPKHKKDLFLMFTEK
jgi:hypothetical protein